jgi:Arc/MetJ family transcription regulator
MAESGVDFVAATLAASLGERLTRDLPAAEAPQALVDLYLAVKGKLQDAAKREQIEISDEALARSRRLPNQPR